MAVSTAVVKALGKPLGPITRQHYGPYLAATGVVFATALRGVIKHWQRPRRPDTGRSHGTVGRRQAVSQTCTFDG